MRASVIIPRMSSILTIIHRPRRPQVRDFANGPFAPFLQPGVARLQQPLNLLCNTLWLEACGFFKKATPHIYGVGIPDSFQVAYLSLTRLKVCPPPSPSASREVALL